MVCTSGTSSSWLEISKGVPQGSILGPALFNLFMNDVVYFLENCTLYNYADDNTIAFISDDKENLVTLMERNCTILLSWFRNNGMKCNPDKFQAIALGTKSYDANISLCVENFTVKCQKEIKLLGVTVDYKMNFDIHISTLCKKASSQLSALKRIGKTLNHVSKLAMYHCFILSNFSYCPLVWHFCSEENVKKMERIQFSALKFIYNDHSSSYEHLLAVSQIPSLYVRRLRLLAILRALKSCIS